MPRKPRAEAPGRPISVKLSPLERRRLERAARTYQQTVSAFVRSAIDEVIDVRAADDDAGCVKARTAGIG
jgi:predicted transcriptional regulator